MSKRRKKARRGRRPAAKHKPPPEGGAPRTALRWGLGGLVLLAVATVALVLAQPRRPDTTTPASDARAAPSTAPRPLSTTVPESLKVEVVRRYPHDRGAFTQGLLLDAGRLFESTGLRGRSSVREVDLQTGEVLRLRRVDDAYFGEGLAKVGERLIQLTWQSGRAFVYEASELAPLSEYRYGGEGWGLCFDGEQLVMSDGTPTLTFRDPESFEVRRRVEVTKIGRPLRNLNELECVGGAVYANVWQTDEIVRIDPATGAVTASIDASGLLSLSERSMADVLNGIAYVPERETFLVTGKLWPTMFEVRFVPN